MATSPIYGWPEPDNTDLVKNGALAIRTLGDAIDTTMGTVTPKSVFTAKGSIAVATAASTPANLSVGANGSALYADSTTASGLRYTNTPSASNPILNSAMQVAQRGTTFTAATGSTYTLDRWQGFRGAGVQYNISQQLTSDTTNLPFIQHCARVGRPSGNTAVNAVYYAQSFETLNSRPFASKVITVSFYARKGADYSAASNALVIEVATGTGTDQNIISGFTGSALVVNQTSTLTTTWQRFTYTSTTLSSSMTQLGLNFYYTPVGTAGANDYFEVTGVQIDIASFALPFRTDGTTYQQELAACQRYYQRQYPNAVTAGLGTGFADGTTVALIKIPLKVTMRIAPTALEQSGTAADYGARIAGGTTVACNAVPTFFGATADEAYASFPFASGLTAGNGLFGRAAGTAAYLGWSAEL